MIDNTELAYRQSLAIPSEIRADVAKVVERNKNMIRWPDADLKYLFEVWNRYMTKDPEDITCPGCRSKVVSKMRRIVGIWVLKEEI